MLNIELNELGTTQSYLTLCCLLRSYSTAPQFRQYISRYRAADVPMHGTAGRYKKNKARQHLEKIDQFCEFQASVGNDNHRATRFKSYNFFPPRRPEAALICRTLRLCSELTATAILPCMMRSTTTPLSCLKLKMARQRPSRQGS